MGEVEEGREEMKDREGERRERESNTHNHSPYTHVHVRTCKQVNDNDNMYDKLPTTVPIKSDMHSCFHTQNQQVRLTATFALAYSTVHNHG